MDIVDHDTLAAVRSKWIADGTLPLLFTEPPQSGRLKGGQGPLYGQMDCQFLRAEHFTGRNRLDWRKVTLTVRGVKADVLAAMHALHDVFYLGMTLPFAAGTRFLKWWPLNPGGTLVQDEHAEAGQDIWMGILEAEVQTARTDLPAEPAAEEAEEEEEEASAADWSPVDIEGLQVWVNAWRGGIAANNVFWHYDRPDGSNNQPNVYSDGAAIFAVHYANALTSIVDKLRLDNTVPWVVETNTAHPPAYLVKDSGGDINTKEAGENDGIHQGLSGFIVMRVMVNAVTGTQQVLLDTNNGEAARVGFRLRIMPTTGVLNFQLSNNSGSSFGIDYDHTIPVLTGEPTVLGFSLDAGRLTLIVNGARYPNVATFSGSPSTATAYSTMIIMDSVVGSYLTEGRFYELAFGTSPLSAGDLNLFNGYRPQGGTRIRSPKLAPGLTAWWSPDDWGSAYTDSAQTDLTTEGDPVGGLKNKLNPGTYDLSAATTARPTITEDALYGGYHYAVLRFDGSTDRMTADALAAAASGTDVAWTACLALLRDPAGSGARTVLSFGHSTGTGKHEIRLNADNTLSVIRTDDAGNTATATTTATLDPYVSTMATLEVHFTGTTLTLTLNDSEIITAQAHNVGATTLDRFALGCLRTSSDAQFFQGVIAEAALWVGSTPSGSRRAYMRSYLTSKHRTIQSDGRDPAAWFEDPPS